MCKGAVLKLGFLFLILIFWGAWQNLGLCKEPEKDLDKISRSLKKEIEIQNEVDNWSQEKQRLVNEILNLKSKLEWTKFQNKKYRSYIQQEKETIADLQRQKQELKTLRIELEPFLFQVVETLKQFVANDLPFLPEERKERFAFLEESLTKRGIDLHERMRRVFEGLQVETNYGNSVEVNERKIKIQGNTKQVQVLRLGRLNLYYKTLDGQEVGHWEKKTGKWDPLPDEYNQDIKKTIEIAQQKRAAELVDLPVGKVKDKIEKGSEQ